MSNINTNDILFINDKELYSALKYIIKLIVLFKIINPASTLEELDAFIMNLTIYKKCPKSMHAFARLRSPLMEGKLIFFNGQLNSFTKFINHKLYSELVIIHPELTKSEFGSILLYVLEYPIFKKLFTNGSNIRTRK